MAKKKRPAGETPGNVVHLHVDGGGNAPSGAAGETDDEEFADLDAAEEGQLSRAIEDVRRVEGAKAEVLKEIEARWAFCRVYAIAAFSHDRVAQDFGAGKYRVRFKGPGDKYIRGGGGFDIAEGVGGSAPAPTAGPVAELLSVLKEERARDREEREKRKGEMIEWAKLIVPLALPKLLEIFAGGAKGPTLPELIRAVKDMKDLQAPAQNITAQFAEVMGVLQGAKDLVGDDGAKGGSTWVDLVRDFISSPTAGALANAIPGMMARPGQPQFPPTPNASAPSPALAAPSNCANPSGSARGPATASQGGDGVLQQLTWLRHTLNQLFVQAQKQANPRLYAEVVLDNLPDYIAPQALLERLQADTWWAQLQQVDGRIAPHQEWFQKFRDYAVRALTRHLRKAQEQNAPAPPADGMNEPMGDEHDGS